MRFLYFIPLIFLDASRGTLVKNFRSFAYFKAAFVDYYLVQDFPVATGFGSSTVAEDQCALACLLQEGCNAYLSLAEETQIVVNKDKYVRLMY